MRTSMTIIDRNGWLWSALYICVVTSARILGILWNAQHVLTPGPMPHSVYAIDVAGEQRAARSPADAWRCDVDYASVLDISGRNVWSLEVQLA